MITRRKPLRRKTYLLASTKRIRKVGRIGMKRAIGMSKARKAYFDRFGQDYDHTRIAPCQMCERMIQELGMDFHHKLKRSQGGDEQPGNMIGLCRQDHDRVHRDPALYELVKQSEVDIITGGTVKVPA